MTDEEPVRVGVAGWANPPAEREKRKAGHSHLAHYARYFSCVEINSSFYSNHQPATYRRWREDTPEGFRFSVKMPRSVTHESQLRRCTSEVARFYEEISSLGPKLSAVLVQLPPSLEFSGRTVRAFFKGAPRSRGVHTVCEPRHTSWFTPSADEALAELRVSRVAADPPRHAGAELPGGARKFAYYRWHGSPRMYYSAYSQVQLNTFADALSQARAAHTWCIFDNTALGAAWKDALLFRKCMARQARKTS